MDELIVWGLLFLLASIVGWICGIVGFVRAGRALAEVAALRATIAAMVAVPQALPAEPLREAAPAPRALTPPPLPSITPPAPVPPLAAAPPRRKRRDLEELLTLRWGVWLGAAALLLSGVFLVRYAADEGLLGPAMRCAAMAVLGLALIAGAEWLRRRPVPMDREGQAALADQAPPALAAGGVAILFAAAYAAGVLFALVPPPVGFALMAAAALVGLALSLRFGQLVAAVGVVGAFLVPGLVESDTPSLPGLFAYLLFVTAAALATVRYAAWVWLGWATTIAGALWVALAAMTATPADAWAPALFVPAAALLNLVLLPVAALEHPVGRHLAWVPLAALGVAGLLAALAIPDPVTRAGVLLLAPVTIGKAAREARLARLPWLAAGLFLALLLLWGLPDWRPTGEVIATEDMVMAILPGAWLPELLRPLLWTAAGMALLFMAAGLWFERRSPRPLAWSALGAVPVLALAVLYARVTAFQPDDLWAGGALALAIVLTAAAGAAMREGGVQRAGIHAASAVAALALGCAMVLTQGWLTLALALLLPALAWIEARADLPALRRVALVVAGLALVRLLLNPSVLDYATGEPVLLNRLLPVYLVAAGCFAASVRLFRRRADDGLVALLELGACAFATMLVVLEIRHWATGGTPGTADTGFLELALQVSALALLATLTLRLAARTPRPALGWAWHVQGGLALAGGVGLVLFNPALVDSGPVGGTPILNALLPAYALPGLLAALALRLPGPGPGLRRVLTVYALVAAFVWLTLEVRHGFHPSALGLDEAPVEDAELWAWSGAWLAFGAALMAAGLIYDRKGLRLAALAIIGLAGAKVFLVDMAGLVGLWRVLSFLGLGLTLIGLGAVYRRFLGRPVPDTQGG